MGEAGNAMLLPLITYNDYYNDCDNLEELLYLVLREGNHFRS